MKYSTLEDVDFGICEEPEVAFQINRELNLARRIIEETGANLFLTGKAGTGKTTFLKHLLKTSDKRMIVLAPTGVAAINCGGMTINSFFQFPFSPFIPGKGFAGEKRYYSFSKAKKRIISSLDLLVIDEISMVRADILDAIDVFLRRMRNPNQPFGGVQLLLIGDLRQLPPVLREEEKTLLSPYYESPYFFDSRALSDAGFLTIELETIYRQTDERFIDILNALRIGKPEMWHLEELNRRYIPDFKTGNVTGYINLTTHNWQADQINNIEFNNLKGEIQSYRAQIEGTFPESSFPVSDNLNLKVGCQVMFIKNDTGENRRFYNGMIGEVIEMSDNTVVVAPIDGSDPIEVEPVKWENYKYEIDEETKKIIQTTEGIFFQLPLRLAWAITVHKSQGLTFDKAIIEISRSFAPGQAYVALSRCRTLDGLVLKSPLSASIVTTDRDVNRFAGSDRNIKPDDKILQRLRGEYYRRTLAEIFNFHTIELEFEDLMKNVLEFVAPINPEYFSVYKETAEKLKKNIVDVGLRFSSLYAVESLDADSAETSDRLQEKIHNGASYFIKELNDIKEVVDHTDFEIENSKYQEQLQKSYEIFNYNICLRLLILNALQTEKFTPAAFYRIKAEALIDLENESGELYHSKKKGKNKGNKAKPKKEKREKGYSQYQSLKMFKSGKSIEEIAEERGLVPATIAGHLANFVLIDEIKLSDLLDPDKIEILKRIRNEAADNSDFLQKALPYAKRWEISLFIRIYNKPTNNSASPSSD